MGWWHGADALQTPDRGRRPRRAPLGHRRAQRGGREQRSRRSKRGRRDRPAERRGGYTLVELADGDGDPRRRRRRHRRRCSSSGMNAEADQNRRFQAQQDGRVALDKMRREIHAACTVSTPATYNTRRLVGDALHRRPTAALRHATRSRGAPSGSGARYGLYRDRRDELHRRDAEVRGLPDDAATIFTYLPPNSHIASPQTLGRGTSSTTIVTTGRQHAAAPPRRLDVNLQLERPARRLPPHDDIAFRNGPRGCLSGASC